MKFKKFLAVLLSAAMIFAFTACGDEKSDVEKYSVKIGMLKYMNVGEQQFSELMKKIADTFSLKITPHEVVFFDNLNAMQMAYKNPNITILKDHTMEFVDAFCLAMNERDKDLFAQVDKVVKDMRNDGTLENLEKKYIKDLKAGAEPEAVEFEQFDGAETIKVAITGDLPPIDLILADGRAAGYNTAVLSEIGKRLHKNIELVQIESAARAAALESGRVDISFWAIVPVSEIIPSNADKPDGIVLSTPYYRGQIVHVGFDGEKIDTSAGLGNVVGDLAK